MKRLYPHTRIKSVGISDHHLNMIASTIERAVIEAFETGVEAGKKYTDPACHKVEFERMWENQKKKKLKT